MKSVFEIADNYDIKLLKKQGFELGDIIKNKSELEKGELYCIVDTGMANWQGGYEYNGFKNGKHTFVSTLGDDTELYYTDEELVDAITNLEVADCI